MCWTKSESFVPKYCRGVDQKNEVLDLPQVPEKVTGTQVRQNSVMKEQTTLKLLLKIVIKEGASGGQEDSTQGQKSCS